MYRSNMCKMIISAVNVLPEMHGLAYVIEKHFWGNTRMNPHCKLWEGQANPRKAGRGPVTVFAEGP